jgi:hypothetical protein
MASSNLKPKVEEEEEDLEDLDDVVNEFSTSSKPSTSKAPSTSTTFKPSQPEPELSQEELAVILEQEMEKMLEELDFMPQSDSTSDKGKSTEGSKNFEEAIGATLKKMRDTQTNATDVSCLFDVRDLSGRLVFAVLRFTPLDEYGFRRL